MPKPIQNVSAYHFARLDNVKELRDSLGSLCRGVGLRGTILLSGEGINLFVAGTSEAVRRLLDFLQAMPDFAGLQAKYSESDHCPFNRMLVRVKKEIIAFGVEGIDPASRTSPKIAPKELKRWLDEGRPLTLLDTRNDYEVRLGTFKNALPIGVDHFRQFPEAVQRLPEELKSRPVVMFCTGGIRCEKAGPFMESRGFNNIYQLDGGILRYFEDCGSDHWEGECFVFDHRVGVNPELKETSTAICFNCREPLTLAEQQDERYLPPHSCPHCHLPPKVRMEQSIARRHDLLRKATTPLPGSAPYENFRPLTAPEGCGGMALIDLFCQVVPHVSREQWLESFTAGLIKNDAREVMAPGRIVEPGERFLRILPETVEPDVNAAIQVLHEDEALLVLLKPAPLPMHPGGRYNRNSLQHFLDEAFHPEKARPAHRLDANTTGVVVFTRARRHASRLQPQFMRGEVSKTYLAKVLGHPERDEFHCDLPISAEAGEIGSREADVSGEGLAARTEFKVIRRDPDGTALLEARPLTGRTNQIRVHLWEMGWPVLNDPAYRPGRVLGTVQTLGVDDPPLCLHSWRIAFQHPIGGERVEFAAPPPAWSGLGEGG